jgi:redox-sensitive bicupin YhaK (pirin superfamily)
MTQVRKVNQVLSAYETLEGAGVRLRRAFGLFEVPRFDPFLMLDDFRIDKPEDYLAGFPLHPQRGIETITYLLEGAVDYRRGAGSSGTITAGDLLWMTAGSGILHEEMPRSVNGRLGGFHLWINLPCEQKMVSPGYREVKKADIPVVTPRSNVIIRVICGCVTDAEGPVRDPFNDIQFLDISLGPDTYFVHPTPSGYTAAAYVIDGQGTFEQQSGRVVKDRDVVLFADGASIWGRALGKGMRFLFLSGRPYREPVVWRESIVMNTREELRAAFREIEDGSFVKTRA